MKEHYQNIQNYYLKSRIIYDKILFGAKHLGYRPIGQNLSERKAQNLMHDKIAEVLDITHDMKILDAGCGQGVVSVYLVQKYSCNITGITIVPFEINRSKNLSIKKEVTNKTNYYLMDYNQLNFNNNSFDAIYTIESLVHSINIKNTLREFYRVLKNNGKIALFEYALDKTKKLNKYEQDMFNKVCMKSSMPALKKINHKEFIHLLEKVGFKNINFKNINDNVSKSVFRLKRIFYIPYLFIKLLKQQQNFPNLTGINEFAKLGEKGILKYTIFTAKK